MHVVQLVVKADDETSQLSNGCENSEKDNCYWIRTLKKQNGDGSHNGRQAAVRSSRSAGASWRTEQNGKNEPTLAGGTCCVQYIAYCG